MPEIAADIIGEALLPRSNSTLGMGVTKAHLLRIPGHFLFVSGQSGSPWITSDGIVIGFQSGSVAAHVEPFPDFTAEMTLEEEKDLAAKVSNGGYGWHLSFVLPPRFANNASIIQRAASGSGVGGQLPETGSERVE